MCSCLFEERERKGETMVFRSPPLVSWLLEVQDLPDSSFTGAMQAVGLRKPTKQVEDGTGGMHTTLWFMVAVGSLLIGCAMATSTSDNNVHNVGVLDIFDREDDDGPSLPQIPSAFSARYQCMGRCCVVFPIVYGMWHC